MSGQDRVQQAQDAAHNTYQDASKQGQSAIDNLKGAVGHAQDKASEAYNSAKDQAGQTYNQVKDQAGQTYDAAKDKAGQVLACKCLRL
jgi:vacuolar-type H+-ATPase subunit H